MSNRERTDPARAGGLRAKRYEVWPGSPGGLPAAEPTVRIVFHGLLGFFFDGHRSCFVGTHNTTAHPGHPHPHRYEINVWEKPGGACPRKPTEHYLIGNPTSVPELNISVTDPDILDGVYVYARDPFTPGDPYGTNDRNDWRWVIDFDELHPAEAGVNFDTLLNGVTIDNGLLHTVRLTRSKFKIRPPGGPDKPIAHVAHYVAANIYLKQPDGKVTLSGGPFGAPRELRAGLGMTYQVDVFNDCHDGSSKCTFDPGSGDPTHRNDFHLYYDTLDGVLEFQHELILSGRARGAVNPRGELRAMNVCEVVVARSDDDAPCGAVGYDETSPPG